MQRVPSICRSAWFYFAVVCLPLAAGAADSRLAGYWTSVPEATEQSSFNIGLLGKWVIVNQHWADTPGDVKLRYLAVTAGDTGTLTADEPPERQPTAPRTILYELQNGELLLTFPGAAHAGRYRLVKSTPPAAAPARLTGTVDFSKPGLAPVPAEPVRPSAPPAKPAPSLQGSWTTDQGRELQLTLHISKSRTADAKINQMWTKGSDNPLVSKNGDYNLSFANGRGTLTQAKPDYEGSAIPPVLKFTFEGDALVITVDSGNYAGQYRLHKN